MQKEFGIRKSGLGSNHAKYFLIVVMCIESQPFVIRK